VRVLAVDPGREKCGVAVCGPEGVVASRVTAVSDLPGLVRDWAKDYGVDAVVVGDQTGCKHVLDLLRALPVRVERAVAVETVRRGQHGHGARLPDQRHQQRRRAEFLAETLMKVFQDMQAGIEPYQID